MRLGSRSALAPAWLHACGGTLFGLALALACLAGCVADPAPQRAVVPANDSRALAADLNARLDALQRQPEPASDDVIASLERTLREQRERRARAVVAAGNTSAIPPGGVAVGVATRPVPPKPKPAPQAALVAAPVAAPVAVAIAAASAPSKSAHAIKVQARAASAPTAMPLPTVVYTSAATVAGPVRTPMSRTSESHMPVDELYVRARDLELQLQVIPAIGLYREASQRGHAASSRRLMELYADGAPGVARDYRVAVFFKERAVQQGADFDPVFRR